MAADWDFYLCYVNDRPASIALDLGLRNTAPQPERPHLLWVFVQLHEPRADGLSQHTELRALYDIQTRLSEDLSERLDGVRAGSITGSGRREFYYYAPNAENLAEIVTASMASFPDYTYEFGEQLDSEWRQFSEVLFPSNRDMQCILTHRAVKLLKDGGYALGSLPQVNHILVFPSDQSRQTFISQVQTEGFRLLSTDFDEEDDEGLAYEVVVCHHKSIHPDALEEDVLHLCDLAGALGGPYVGWETTVAGKRCYSGNMLLE